MLKKLYNMALPRDLELRERLFRVILLVGGLVSLVSTVVCIILMDFDVILIPMTLLLATMGISMIATFKYRKFELSAIIVEFIISFIFFPTMFFFSGGVESGAMVWLALGLIYVFVMFSGKKMVLFIVLSFVIDIGTYVVAYHCPDYIVPMESRAAIYMDSLLAVLLTSVALGVILKFQIKMFEEERAVTLAQKEEIEKISASKNVFFANMSHEIRTPINTIIGLNEMILREEASEAVKEYAGNIQMASKMLLNLVNDILDLSQMEMKKMEISPGNYKMEELFEELVDIVQVQMEEKKLEFILDIDQNLPSVLYGDEKRIKQIVLNILSNAVKYTKTGSVTLAARSEHVEPDKISLQISVTDTGIGIRKEDLEYLFDYFRRVDEKNNVRIEGSGLGLSITKQLVDLMGGEITVDSIYTKGSVFTVIFEQKIIDKKPMGNIDFLEKNDYGAKHRYKRSFEAPEARVLIVDDYEMNAVIASKLLSQTKVQVDIAKSGEECLQKTKQKYYHVILMDHMMPKMDGAETLKELRKQKNGLCKESAVIVLTASSYGEARHLYEENGFDGYLEKPFESAKLEAEILKNLPEDIIEYRLEPKTYKQDKNKIQQMSGRKRKTVCITSDCVCDLPEELLEKYDIQLMYFYIRTDKGRFADTREIDSDNLSRYLSSNGSEAVVDTASVEEYEEFFAGALTQAQHVIHIGAASHVGKSYEIAANAAKGFDHVKVIDSGQISGGLGLIVLHAAKLAMQGRNRQEICAAIKKIRIDNTFLMPTAGIFYQMGYTNKVTESICNVFQLHPVLTMHQSKLIIIGTRIGNIETSWKHYIQYHLWPKRKVSTEAVIITHVSCSVKQLELIREEVLRCIPFDKVIIQKASCSNACNLGAGTISIAYYQKI